MLRRAIACIAMMAVHCIDVCVEEDLSKYWDVLCPATFRVSRTAFNPHGPGLRSEMTIVIAPSLLLPSTLAQQLQLILTLPGFSAPDDLVKYQNDTDKRLLKVVGSNYVGISEDPLVAYNSDENPLLEGTGIFFKKFHRLLLNVNIGKTIKMVDTEFRICCFILPKSLDQDAPELLISAPTKHQASTDDFGTTYIINDQSIKNTPAINRGNFWEYSRIMFDPPTSNAITVVSAQVQPANAISDEARITVFLPTMLRVEDKSGPLKFSTEGTEWLLFLDKGYWNKTDSSMSFYLRPGVTLDSGRKVTFRTLSGEFRLPLQAEPNWKKFQVEARSLDGVDEVVPRSPVHQSDHVPPVRRFTFSELSYSNNKALEFSDVTARFRTNRASFKGSEIYFRLSGFSARVIEIPIVGPYRDYFLKQRATFDMPKNVITLTVSQTLYSNENVISVTFVDIRLPPALYENDESLLIWNSDFAAEKQVIQTSPEIVDPIHGPKQFILSEMVFTHPAPEPNIPSNVTFQIQPSVNFYQGDIILIHLYGFLCTHSDIPLDGPDISLFDNEMANWNPTTSIITLRVAVGRVVSRIRTTVITIPGEQVNFRLPDRLSENDGILMIQGIGAYINKEPIRKSPALGTPKKVTFSSLTFIPCSRCKSQLSESNAKVVFSFIVNSDILANSTIYFKLSGLSRAPRVYCCNDANQCTTWCPEASGHVRMSGRNAPLFRDSMGYWDAMNQLLSVQIIPEVKIPAGDNTQFFIEEDQQFYLPYAMEKDDRSLFMYIPEAGITKHFFDSTSRVNRLNKEFVVSELRYGEEGSVAYPNSNTQILIFLKPNVNLPQGTIIRIYLPGFRSANEKIPLKATVDYDLQAATHKNFKYDAELGIWYGNWTQATQTLNLEVEQGRYINKDEVTEIRLPKIEAGFRLPDGLQPNDESLQVETVNNQIISARKIQVSPRVVDRTFEHSSFIYSPNEKDSYFLFKISLKPTVDIGKDNTLYIKLPNFRNKLGKTIIHVTGASASSIQSQAIWDEETFTLSFGPTGEVVLKAFEMIDLQIQESQGFILPNKLYENHPTLLIHSMNNILQEQIKESLMVGDGPDENQRVCAYQYEAGVRTENPFCDNPDCLRQHLDACSEVELNRCECQGKLTTEPTPLTIHGFQFKPEDSINFVHAEQACNDTSAFLNIFDLEKVNKSMNAEQDKFRFPGLSAIQTGYFRMCFQHMGVIKDIGTLTVRPSCRAPLVLVEGACVTHCPRTKTPRAGECQKDPLLMQRNEQAVMLSIIMKNPDAVGYEVWQKNLNNEPGVERPERTYFEYRFRYEVARVLNVEPERFFVVSISKGPTNSSFYVNAVFKPETKQQDGGLRLDNLPRSPLSLLSLFTALIEDDNSILWLTGDFLKHIDRASKPRWIEVSRCGDELYRTMCKYVPIGKDANAVATVFFLVVFGVLLLVLLFVCLLWRIDFEQSKSKSETEAAKKTIHKPALAMDPSTKAEFAKSWVESRFFGETREGFSLKKKVAPKKNTMELSEFIMGKP